MLARKRVKLAFLLLLLLLFCWQLVQAPWFLAIREVEVKNITTLSPWEVEQIAGIYRGTSLLKVDTKQLQQRLEADERILEAAVKRRFPQTIVITVQENVGVAAIPYFNSWLEVNQEGRVLSVTNHFSTLNLPIITGLNISVLKVGDFISDLTRWQIASECLSQLPASLLGQISEINVKDTKSIVFYSRDPLRILIGDSNNLPRKFEALDNMLDRVREDQQGELATGQLDVSSGRAVFIKGT